MVMVVALGREEEDTKLAPVETAALARENLGASDVLGGVGTDPPVDVGKAVEAADGRQPPVDGRRASPRSSLAARHSSMCGRLASRTASPTPVHHSK